MSEPCPFCNRQNVLERPLALQISIKCSDCGEFSIIEDLMDRCVTEHDKDDFFLSKLRYALGKREEKGEARLIDESVFDSIFKSTLPTPYERIQNLILWLGDKLKTTAKPYLQIESRLLASVTGSVDRHDIKFVIKNAEGKGWIVPPSYTMDSTIHNISLTFNGWEEYNRLTTKRTDSNLAFMAMSFSIPALEDIYNNHFKPAVTQTGFRLREIREEAPAGHIGNRLILEIRRSAFMICDLTGDKKNPLGNAGAYWEAGYASGFDIPVIYTCEKKFFKQKGTHFDTSHHNTIEWDESDPETAVQRLKNTIRITMKNHEKVISFDDDTRE